MWETFTTKPWFDSGELKKAGEIDTPWPAFSFVARSNIPSEANQAIKESFFAALYKGVCLFNSGDATIAPWYHSDLQDAPGNATLLVSA